MAENGRVTDSPQFRWMLDAAARPEVPFSGEPGLEVFPLHPQVMTRLDRWSTDTDVSFYDRTRASPLMWSGVDGDDRSVAAVYKESVLCAKTRYSGSPSGNEVQDRKKRRMQFNASKRLKSRPRSTPTGRGPLRK